MTEHSVTQQIEQYKQQNPYIEETMHAYQHVLQIYQEAAQIMREAEMTLWPQCDDK